MTQTRPINPASDAQQTASQASAEEAFAQPAGSLVRRAAVGEDGLVAWVTLVAIVVMLTIISLLGNVGQVVTQKIETQNAADSVAYSGAVWMVRGMNSITAANHLIGELMALYTLHHAVGAEYLDKHYSDKKENSGPLTTTNFYLETGYRLAQVLCIIGPGPVEDAYDVTKKDPVADEDSADFEGKRQLKQLISGVFFFHAVGGLLEDVIITFAIGQAICYACVAMEYKIDSEYRVLNLFEDIALNLSATKQNVIPMVMLFLRGYTGLVAAAMPAAAHDVAHEIGVRTHTKGSLAGPLLPVVVEPTEEHDRSQLMRASYPWVVHGRESIVSVLRWTATLSGTGGYYVKWTNHYSHTLCEEFRDERDFKLFVLPRMNPPDVDKGHEYWTTRDGSREAESLFCWLGVARRDNPPTVIVGPIFRQEVPDGVLCVSQAMIYNANQQIRYGGWHNASDAPLLNVTPPPEILEFCDLMLFKYTGIMSDVHTAPIFPTYAGWFRQPQIGWDTLGWTANAPEYVTNDDGIENSPVVTLNWQAKLTPVTQEKIRRALPALQVTDPPAAEIIQRRADVYKANLQDLLTH